MLKIVLCGGGTAGHIMPNIALIPELQKFFDKIIYIGGDGMEKEIVSKYGIPFFSVPVVKFERKKILPNLKIPSKMLRGIKNSEKILKEVKPDIVFSKGGYASLPICLSAKKLNIPVVCHESDYTLGLANKIISLFAVKTITSFPETKGGVFIGNPIREDFFKQNNSVFKFSDLNKNKKTILFCGGSLGAEAINKALYEILPTLSKKYNVIHIAGKHGDFSVKYPDYHQYVYTDDFPSMLRTASLVVSRGGANTLCEIASLGKRCVAIPLPKGTSRGDQELNAESFEKRGYCKVLAQSELNTNTLLSLIEEMLANPAPSPLKNDVNRLIVREIVSSLKENCD